MFRPRNRPKRSKDHNFDEKTIFPLAIGENPVYFSIAIRILNLGK